MSIIHWLGGHNTSFADALNWSPQQVPGAGDDALIDLAGVFTVQAIGAFSVESLAVAAQATLDVKGSFSVAAGSAPGGIAGTLALANGGALNLGGTVLLSGTIALDGAGAATALLLTSRILTLSGGGQLVLTDNAANEISGALGDTLVNAGITISGAGTIGAGQVSLINQAHGLIQASGSNKLVLSVPADLFPGEPLFQIINAGTLAALAGSELDIEPGIGPTLQNVGGTIVARGAGAVVAIGGVVSGGTLRSNSGGRIASLGTASILDGQALHPVTNAGSLLITAQAPLALKGSIINTGTIAQDFDHSELDIASPLVTLSGGGKVVLTDAQVNRVLATNALFTLDNVDNTISGAGQLGLGTLTLVNSGTINANRAIGIGANQLVVNTGANPVVNTGLMEATSTGGLRLVNPVLNQGGTIKASGSNAHVDLAGGGIMGGTLKTAGAATIDVIATTSLDGRSDGALANAGLLSIAAGHEADLLGTIVNSGTILLQPVGAGSGQTMLALRSQTVTLSGGGKLVLGDGQAVIAGGDFNQFVNADNTITGQGRIGNGVDMPIANAGTIAAVGGDLVLDTGSDLLTNTGLLKATHNATLDLSRTVANTGGTIVAIGSLAEVFVEDSTIEGGILQTSGGGTIFLGLGLGSSLDGLDDGALTNTGTVTIGKGVNTDLRGSIVNRGLLTVAVSAAIGETDLVLRSPVVTLSGGGRLRLNNADTVLRADGKAERLVNLGTIAGGGTIGSADMRFSNAGHVVADTVTPLTLNLAGMTNEAAGVVQATGAGGIVLAAGVFTNNGTMEAGVGSSITLPSAAFLTNFADGILQGGTYRVIAGADPSSITLSGGNLDVDAANIVLSGAGAQLIGGFGVLGTPPIEATLGSITADGSLHLLGGRNFIAAQTLALAGVLQLAGGTLQAPALSVAGTGRLFGFGTVQDDVADAGRIEAQGGTLAVTGAVSSGGTLQADAGATVALAGTTNAIGVLHMDGTIALGAGDRLDVTTSVDPTGIGLFLLGAGAALELAADTGTGRIAFMAGATLAVDNAASFGSNVGLATYAGPRIEDFVAGDRIDLKNVLFAGASKVFNPVTGLLQINLAGTGVATLAFDPASLGSGSFHLANDGADHLLLSRS